MGPRSYPPDDHPWPTLAKTILTPMLLETTRRARELYDRACRKPGTPKNELLDRGRSARNRSLRSPQRQIHKPGRIGLAPPSLHKWTMRTCFHAQEEIYRASLDEVSQLREVHPTNYTYIGSTRPHIRAGIPRQSAPKAPTYVRVKVLDRLPKIERDI